LFKQKNSVYTVYTVALINNGIALIFGRTNIVGKKVLKYPRKMKIARKNENTERNVITGVRSPSDDSCVTLVRCFTSLVRIGPIFAMMQR